MKTRASCLLFALLFCLSLLPLPVMAATTMIRHIDITLESPRAGMTMQEGRQLTMTAGAGDGVDLFTPGILRLQSITSWNGEFDETDRSNPRFVAGRSYIATIRLAIDAAQGYMANCDLSTYITDGSMLSVTVNGSPATVTTSSCGYPVVQAAFTVPANAPSPGEQNAAEAARLAKHDLRHASLRASLTPYTPAEADALWPTLNPTAPVIVNQPGVRYGQVFGGYSAQQLLGIRTVVLDYASQMRNDQYDLSMIMSYSLPNLREIWISDKVDVQQVVDGIHKGTGPQTSLFYWYWMNSTDFGTADATLYISASALETLRANSFDGIIYPQYTIKIYDGDVYTAQQRGDAATRAWCTDHNYIGEIMSADRICYYETCLNDRQWYYSCLYCGRCEYNPNHTFDRNYSKAEPHGYGTHHYFARLATEEAYIGKNAAGDELYWMSCVVCGHAYRYNQENITEREFALSGVEGSFAQFRQACVDAAKTRESYALIATEAGVDMFTISAKTDARMSLWAQSDINHALDNGLLDTALLGDDFTRDATRLQFCSVAVRLAEALTGKPITPAPASTFTDTTDLYALKAYAAGITTGTTATTFTPDGTLNRQQMGTFIYRALMYVKANSDIRYTPYTSRLAAYTDAGQIDTWALEPLAFMNALDLIKGTSTTTISPRTNCTIEQALAVASRSIYAHQIGWYQVMTDAEKPGLNSANQSYKNYWYAPDHQSNTSPMSLANCDRIWVTGNRMGVGVNDLRLDASAGQFTDQTYLPTVNPYSGQTHYVRAEWLRPIRE